MSRGTYAPTNVQHHIANDMWPDAPYRIAAAPPSPDAHCVIALWCRMEFLIKRFALHSDVTYSYALTSRFHQENPSHKTYTCQNVASANHSLTELISPNQQHSPSTQCCLLQCHFLGTLYNKPFSEVHCSKLGKCVVLWFSLNPGNIINP